MHLKDHVRSRWIDDSIHRVWYDEKEEVATFPLWNLSGHMVGYQQYRPSKDKSLPNHPTESRYFIYHTPSEIRLWGLESWSMSNTLFITEGVFKSARLSSLGYSTVAVMASDVDVSTRRFFYIVKGFRKVVAIGDPGPTGKLLLKYGHVSYHMPSNDVDTASESELHQMFISVGEKSPFSY